MIDIYCPRCGRVAARWIPSKYRINKAKLECPNCGRRFVPSVRAEPPVVIKFKKNLQHKRVATLC